MGCVFATSVRECQQMLLMSFLSAQSYNTTISGLDGVLLFVGSCYYFPRDVFGHVQLFETCGLNENLRRGWRAIWLTVLHGIWIHINNIDFYDSSISVVVTLSLIWLSSRFGYGLMAQALFEG